MKFNNICTYDYLLSKDQFFILNTGNYNKLINARSSFHKYIFFRLFLISQPYNNVLNFDATVGFNLFYLCEMKDECF